MQDNGIAICQYSGQRFVSASYLKKHPELHKQYKFTFPEGADTSAHH